MELPLITAGVALVIGLIVVFFVLRSVRRQVAERVAARAQLGLHSPTPAQYRAPVRDDAPWHNPATPSMPPPPAPGPLAYDPPPTYRAPEQPPPGGH